MCVLELVGSTGFACCECCSLVRVCVCDGCEQSVPKLDDIVADSESRLDDEVGASGFGKEYGERVHDVRVSSPVCWWD